MVPSWFNPIIAKWADKVPIVEKGPLRVGWLGFHSMARPPEASEESVWMELQPFHMRWNMVSASIPAHFISCNIRISGLLALMQSLRILCLDLSLSPLMFQVIIFIIMRMGVGGGIPPRAYASDLSWSWGCLLLWLVDVLVFVPFFCSRAVFFFSLSLILWLCLSVSWIPLLNLERPCVPFGVALQGGLANPSDWELPQVFQGQYLLILRHPSALGCLHLHLLSRLGGFLYLG